MVQRTSIALATIVSKSYLSFARVLAESIRRMHPDLPFFVLLADEPEACFDPAEEPFEMIRLDELRIPELARFRFHYTQQPLTYASTPFLLAHLIARGCERVIFVKQESLVAIPDIARRLYQDMGDTVHQFGNPFHASAPNSYFHWLNEPADDGSATDRISRIWHAVYLDRPDLQQAFPELSGTGSSAYRAWIAARGLGEYQVDEAFAP